MQRYGLLWVLKAMVETRWTELGMGDIIALLLHITSFCALSGSGVLLRGIVRCFMGFSVCRLMGVTMGVELQLWALLMVSN